MPFASGIGGWVYFKALRSHGGYGQLEDYLVDHHYPDSRSTERCEGSREILRPLITRKGDRREM